MTNVGDLEYGGAGLVRSGQVDGRADATVVVAGRVVEDLPARPRGGPSRNDQQPGAARVGAGPDRVVLLVVLGQRVLPRVSVPARSGVQVTQVVEPPQRRELDPAEQRVRTQPPESPPVL